MSFVSNLWNLAKNWLTLTFSFTPPTTEGEPEHCYDGVYPTVDNLIADDGLPWWPDDFEVRRRAYSLWETDVNHGNPERSSEDYWHEASGAIIRDAMARDDLTETKNTADNNWS